jgi:hypothetical protein
MSRPFADVLRDLAGGQAYETLTLELAHVVQEVIKTQKAGALSLTLNITANGPGSVQIAESIKSKVPELPKGKTLFFATEAGTLTRDDPRQEKLNLRDVSEPRGGALREVG